MRHSRDIVQACPGGGPVIPNQSLAEQRLERKIRTQEFRFFSSYAFFFFFFNECLIKTVFYFPTHTHTHTHTPPVPSASLHISFHSILFIITFILYWSSLPCLWCLLTVLYASVCHANIFGYKRVLTDNEHVLGWKCGVCVCVCVCVCTLSLFLLLCWAICNTSQMNTDLFNCINSSLWPGLRSSRGKKMILWG